MTRSKKSRSKRISDRLANLENKVHLASKGPKSAVSSSRSNKAKRRRNRNRNTVSELAPFRRVQGKDLIASFSVSSDQLKDGTPLAKIAVTPRSFAKSRLAVESALWNQWKPKKLRVTVKTTIPLLGNGMLVLAWSSQPNEIIGSVGLAPTRLLTMRPSRLGAMGTPNIIDIPTNNLRMPWYLCQGTNDLTDHGTILVCVGGAATNVSGNVGFLVELEYDIEFNSPDITPQAELDTIYADEGWYPYFTTSDGSFADAKKLTLKRHEGGDPCQFSDAVPGTVYELGTKSSLNYYKDTTNKGQIKFLTRIHTSALPHVAVFEEKSKALEYAKNGDIANCLNYVSQGDWCTPEDPYWRAVATSVAFSQGFSRLHRVHPSHGMSGKISDESTSFGPETLDFGVLALDK